MHGSALLADDRLARLRDSVDAFGFHLCGLDMRQNSETHEQVVAELLAWAGVHPDYASLPEGLRVELLVAELSTRRPLVCDGAELSELARKELDIVGAGGPHGNRSRRRGERTDLHHLDVSIGVGHAGGCAAAQRSWAA